MNEFQNRFGYQYFCLDCGSTLQFGESCDHGHGDLPPQVPAGE